MFAFLATDVAVEPGFLREVMATTFDETFARMLVDNEAGTNDTFCILCSGRAGNEPLDNILAAGVFIDALRAEGLPIDGFTTTNISKAQIIGQLSLAFEERSIKILDDPVLIAELQSYEATRLPGGSLRYSAPDGQHDDTVMATAIGLEAVMRGGQRLLLW